MSLISRLFGAIQSLGTFVILLIQITIWGAFQPVLQSSCSNDSCS